MPTAPRPPRFASLSPDRPATALTIVGLTTAVLLIPLAAPATASSTTGVDDLRGDLDALLDDPSLQGATSGLVVHSLDTGEVLYERNADTALIPASTTKLLTSMAALEVLAPTHTFHTTVTATEDPTGGVVDGDLHLTGTGDPSLTADAFGDLASEVADSGVHEVTGDLLADDTYFDNERLNPGWDPEDEPYYYAAQISALTMAANSDLDTGVVNVTATPGATSGDAVDVRLAPATDTLDLTNNASTGASDSAPTVDVTRESGTNQFTATGSLPAGGDNFTTLRTVHEPTDIATHLFAEALEDNGVKIHGEVARGTEPDDSTEVASTESEELSALMVPFLKLSNNGHAEILVKTMGREVTGEGSWMAGLTEMEAALNRAGIDLGGSTVSDGSGLARTNQLSADAVTSVLTTAPGEPWFDEWEDALPVAGAADHMDGGTLSSRMRGTPAEGNVRAKTGTLSGASALSGYVTGADGEELVFSVINNDYSGAAPRDVQDAIAVRLAEFTRTSATNSEPDPNAQQDPAGGEAGELECTWVDAC